MTPGQVVYCDRLQYIKLTIPDLFVTVDLGSSAGTFPIFSNDPFVLGLFQRTKNAHSYHYYMGTPATDLHHVQVYVRGIIQCFKDGLNAECQDAGIDIPKLVDGDGAANPIAGGTMAAVGKATLVVQEQQNWREMEPTP